MSYKFLLFDLDHTLLDFELAESIALTQLLEEAKVSDVDAYKNYYIPMNQGLWDDLARKKITKKELIETRFERVFANFGHEVDGIHFAKRYQHFLSQQGQTFSGAAALLSQLQDDGYRLFAATNGVTYIQKGRLERSDIQSYFEQVFISDEIQEQKPDKAFFDVIAGAVTGFSPGQALMIGDSLISDIQGGNNAGINTVWYNPSQKTNDTKARPTYTISSYADLISLLED